MCLNKIWSLSVFHHAERFAPASKALLSDEYEKFKLHYSLIPQTMFHRVLKVLFHVNCIEEACYYGEGWGFTNSGVFFSRQFLTGELWLLLTNTNLHSV